MIRQFIIYDNSLVFFSCYTRTDQIRIHFDIKHKVGDDLTHSSDTYRIYTGVILCLRSAHTKVYGYQLHRICQEQYIYIILLYYGLNKTENNSLDFVIFRTLANIFETFPQDIINKCRTAFIESSPGGRWNKDTKLNSLVRYHASENHFLTCSHQTQSVK